MYYHTTYQRFCPADAKKIPFEDLPGTPENFFNLGWLPAEHPTLPEFSRYSGGSEVDGTWVVGTVEIPLTEAKGLKSAEINQSYQAAEWGTISNAGCTWPASYKFAQIIRDRRDFALEQSGTTINLRDSDAVTHTLAIQEATELLALIGNQAATRADKRDNLLSQIAVANSLTEISNINW